MKLAIVHDALYISGGAERLAIWLSKAFPEAPFYTSVYLPENTFPEYKKMSVKVLPGSKFIRNEKTFKLFYLFWLWQIQKIDFSEFDLVLSSSTYLAKYIKPSPNVIHYSYIHAPFRLLWKPSSYSNESLPTPKIFAPIIKNLSPLLQKWDRNRTQEISRVITSCNNVAKEILDKYQVHAEIISPPIEVSDYPISEYVSDYFLSVSRLISHKRIDIAIQACNILKKKLIIVGDGPERKHLESLAGDTIKFLGRVSDHDLKKLYANARALIFPSHEDYGIVPLEAQACGIPVIAYGAGGVLETVNDETTGMFFNDQNYQSLVEGMMKFETKRFDKKKIRKWVTQFDGSIFIENIKRFVSLD